MQQTLYPFLLSFHNLLRWIVVLFAGWALFRAYQGWFGSRPWTEADRRAGIFFSIALDVQALIGVLLSILSPLVASAVRDMGAAMASDLLRPIVVEHLSMMLLALGLVHVGVARSRKALEDRSRHKQAAIWFTLSVVAILAAIPWGRPLLRWLF